MRKPFLVSAAATGALLLAAVTMNAQYKEALKLVQTIPLPNVKGRIDHMDVDVKGKRLFVSGLENGSLQVVDLQAGNYNRTIPGFHKPHRIPLFPSLYKLCVA